ncbi:MAG: hypothetical protein V3U87_17270 [Methylococcaceae bacterium]
MSDEKVLKLIETFGDDAKQAFYIYLFVEYGSIWLLLYFIWILLKKIAPYVAKDMDFLDKK